MIKRIAAIVLALFVLAGCGPSHMLHIGNAIANGGQGLPDNMIEKNVAGMVAFDETFAGDYGRVARNALFVQGFVEGTPEYQLRAIRINLSNTGENLFWKKGELLFQSAAVAPDHLPQLKAGDIVEVRQTGTWRTVENFVRKQEGNIVVRILCRKAAPDYDTCREKGPSTGIAKGVGSTGSRYLQSVRDYGFAFSPFYSAEGRRLRQFPPS